MSWGFSKSGGFRNVRVPVLGSMLNRAPSGPFVMLKVRGWFSGSMAVMFPTAVLFSLRVNVGVLVIWGGGRLGGGRFGVVGQLVLSGGLAVF